MLTVICAIVRDLNVANRFFFDLRKESERIFIKRMNSDKMAIV